MNMLEFDEISGQADDDRAAAVRKYLTSNGWKYTSRHPGSYWMWSFDKVVVENDVDTGEEVGRTTTVYVVDETHALGFQRYWELEVQHFNTHDAECPIFTTFNWDDCDCMPGVENDTAALDGEVDDRLPSQP